MAMSKYSMERLISESPSESLGKCRECKDGDVILHRSGDYYVCTNRLRDGSCNFSLNCNQLRYFGVRRITIVGMSALLKDKPLYFKTLLNPRTGERLYRRCQISLKKKLNKKTGEMQYMPDVEIFWNEEV